MDWHANEISFSIFAIQVQVQKSLALHKNSIGNAEVVRFISLSSAIQLVTKVINNTMVTRDM